jgi:hypothetical protein
LEYTVRFFVFTLEKDSKVVYNTFIITLIFGGKHDVIFDGRRKRNLQLGYDRRTFVGLLFLYDQTPAQAGKGNAGNAQQPCGRR